jgi:hypothetical protein
VSPAPYLSLKSESETITLVFYSTQNCGFSKVHVIYQIFFVLQCNDPILLNIKFYFQLHMYPDWQSLSPICRLQMYSIPSEFGENNLAQNVMTTFPKSSSLLIFLRENRCVETRETALVGSCKFFHFISQGRGWGVGGGR